MNLFPVKNVPKPLDKDTLELVDMYFDFNYYLEGRALKDMTAFIERKEALYVEKQKIIED